MKENVQYILSSTVINIFGRGKNKSSVLYSTRLIDFDDIYPNRNDNYKLTEDDKSFAEIVDKADPSLLPF